MCANARPLQVSFQDLEGNEMLKFDRPLRCMECCCAGFYPNWTQLLTVYHQNQELGKVREVPVCCTRKHLEVWDKNEEKIYDITGPCCPISCGGDVPFQVCCKKKLDFGHTIKRPHSKGHRQKSSKKRCMLFFEILD